MPVYALVCPKCGHEFRSMVLEGTRAPSVWECSKCGSDGVVVKPGALVLEHPWEQRQYRSVCPCCGL
jgi:rubrerythrin